MGYTLRPYQKECVETVQALPDGARSIVCLATGLGKSLVGAHLPHNGRVLWLSHRDELVRQPQKYFDDQGLSYGIEKADEHSNGEEVVSASVQTLCKDARLHSFSPDDFDLIICDEAHHAAADTYKKVLGYFHPRKLVGLTATPQRGDDKGLTDVFDSICFIRDLRWGIENGYLSRIRNVRVIASFDMNRLQKVMGDFTQSSLNDCMINSNADIMIRDAYIKYSLPQHKRTLVFCPTIETCQKVARTLIQGLPEEEKNTIAVLYSGMPAEERHKILDAYRLGQILCIINCMILTEGADLPETAVIINARPTANSTLYQQIVGRGTRLAKGKEFCLIIDIIGENYRAKNLCTAPTLLGVDPDEVPEQLLNGLDENQDLIGFTDGFSEEINEARNFVDCMRVKYEVYDIFTQEREQVADSDKTLDKRAEEYQKLFLDPYTEEPEFAGLCVRHTPSDNRYYQINATYHDRIYLSKPDMLNKTVITMRGYDMGHAFISDPMPMPDAIHFIREYLTYVVPKQYITQWSEEGRQAMAKSPATYRQCNRLKEIYGKSYKEENLGALTKLGASDLIQLQEEILCSKEKTKEFKDLVHSERKRGKAKEKWIEQRDNYIASERAEEQKLRSRYPQEMQNIKRQIETAKTAGLRQKEKEEQQPRRNFTIPVDGKWYSNAPSTMNQIRFCRELMAHLHNAATIQDSVTVFQIRSLDRWQISIFIDCLKQMQQIADTPHYYPLHFDMQTAYVKAANATKTLIGTDMQYSYWYDVTQKPEHIPYK